MPPVKKEKEEQHFTVRDKFYPQIEKTLKNASNERAFIKFIATYRDQNIDWLSNPTILNKQPLFTDTIRKKICTMFGINKDDIDLAAKDVPRPEELGRDAKPSMNGFNCLLLLIMKYYLELKNETRFRFVCSLYAYSNYPTIWSKYFGANGIHEPTMEYTVDNMIRKFTLKKLGSVEAYLNHNIGEASVYYKKGIMNASDEDLILITSNLQTRLNNSMNKIKNEYEKNRANQHAVFVDEEFNDEGEYISRNGTLGEIESLSNKYTTKFISGIISDKLVTFCAKYSQVSAGELRNTLQIMQNPSKNDEIKDFYAAIFYVFLNGEIHTSIKDIYSMRFPAIMDSIYRKGNSKDKNIILIKSLMNKWLTEGSLTYVRTNRLATQNNFKKAVFMYLTWTVSSNM